MGVIITRDDIIAYAEVDYIINHMNEKYIAMIPESIRKFFATIKEPVYNVNVNPRVPLANQGLKQYTLEILALLHLKYWCQDEERKQELYEKMKRNQLLIEAKLHEQYGVENLFAEETVVTVTSEEDFSKPKTITRYSQIAEQNEDVKDYSDVVFEEDNVENKEENNEETAEKESNSELTSVNTKENIFTKLKNFIRGIFKKK